MKIVTENNLNEGLVHSYACEIDELVRIGSKSLSINISNKNCNIGIINKNNKIKVKSIIDNSSELFDNTTISFFKGDPEKKIILNPIFSDKKVEFPINFQDDKIDRIIFYSELIFVIRVVLSDVLKLGENNIYILPASRSGIIQVHKSLAQNIMDKSPFIGIRKNIMFEIPQLLGTVSNFISYFIQIPTKKGPFYNITKEIENEIIKGEIVIKKIDKISYPEIKYIYKNREIPLHRASSSVSELATLILMLKYKIKKGDILIIEEPEAHIHPGNQLLLVKLFVQLIRKGINVILTTHSDFLLEKFNNYILLDKVKPKNRGKYGDRNDYITPDEISAYGFVYDEKNDGYKTYEIDINEKDGIKQNEFSEIYKMLYDESLRLKNDMNR